MFRTSNPLKDTPVYPWRVSLLYLLVAGGWIVLGWLLATNYTDSFRELSHFELLKGLGFVAITTVLLWFLCRAWAKEVSDAWGRYISGQKSYEEKLLMLNAMLRAVRRVNQAIAHGRETASLIQTICQILIEDRQFKYAWIALVDESGEVEHFSEAPAHPESARLVDALTKQQFPACAQSARRPDGMIVILEPRETCPAYLNLPGHEDASLICVPFSYDKRTGYIGMRVDRSAAEDEEEIRLFRELADDVRRALHTILVESEKAQAVEALIEAKREADKANQTKDEFLAVMSHEMRTPLNPIIGHCNLLQEEITDPDHREALQQINDSGERLLHLIDDILFYTQIENTRSFYSSRNFNVVNLCKEIIESAQPQAAGLDLRLVPPQNPPSDETAFEVNANREMLLRLLLELVSNACKYTQEGSVTLSLEIESQEAAGSRFVFKVKDTGIGIDPKVSQRLFAPFTQLDSSYTRKYGGIGLGLAICKKIADLMEGLLTVESRLQKGSTFIFRCRLRPARHDLENQPDLPRQPRSQTEAEPEIQPNTHKVLVVEDDSGNAKMTRTIIERLKIEVHVAVDGSEAVERCKEHSYALILMDLSLPVMDGFEATKIIRSSINPNRNTPIVGLTAHASEETREECLAAGMRAHLPKPIRLAELRSVVQHFTASERS